MGQIELSPIGVVAGGRQDPVDDDWASVEADIVLDEWVPPDSTAGLGEFSHIDVIFHFDRVEIDSVHVGARHPRNRADCADTGTRRHRSAGSRFAMSERADVWAIRSSLARDLGWR